MPPNAGKSLLLALLLPLVALMPLSTYQLTNKQQQALIRIYSDIQVLIIPTETFPFHVYLYIFSSILGI